MTQNILDSIILYSKAKLFCSLHKTKTQVKKPRKYRRILRRKEKADKKHMLQLAAYIITDLHDKTKTIIKLKTKSNYILNQLKKIHEQ